MPWLGSPHAHSCSPLAWGLPGGPSLSSSLRGLAGRGGPCQTDGSRGEGQTSPLTSSNAEQRGSAEPPVPAVWAVALSYQGP